jgi:multiple sugar transport system permease protein
MRKTLREARLILIGVPIFIWATFPIYHLLMMALTPQETAFAGELWPQHPTLGNFKTVFTQGHYYLSHFWQQILNSFVIGVTVALAVLLIATTTAFAISRLRVRGGRIVMNLALLTYLIPSAFLAIPMYKSMGSYGLLDNRLSLILSMIALASPYAIWVMKQASDKLPFELDEAARIDGATSWQIFRLVYLPLVAPSMVAIGTYALLLAWNEYLFAFLLLSSETKVTLSVGLGMFTSLDDAPWNLLMATGIVYALPPAAIYYTFRKYMVSGLTSGAVKS